MRLHEIAFREYKAYAGGNDTAFQHLTLAPLTLILGKNNSGKSAAVRLPRLILGGLECQDARLLPLEVRGMRYGSRFVDLVHGQDFFRRPSFQVRAEHGGEQLDLEVTLYSSGALTADDPPLLWSYAMRAPESIDLPGPPSAEGEPARFAGLLPSEARWDAWRRAAGTMLNIMIHLGPTRETVSGTYPYEQVGGLGLDGSGAPQWLRVHPSLADAVGSWFARHMDGWRLALKRDSDTFSLRIDRTAALSINFAQGGAGLQQVLPVVVHQLWRQNQDANTSGKGSGGGGWFLDVVEQPELHLHAAAQAPLADHFIHTALQGRGQVLVETNSNLLLLRVQRRVAERKLPAGIEVDTSQATPDRGCALSACGVHHGTNATPHLPSGSVVARGPRPMCVTVALPSTTRGYRSAGPA